MYASACDRFLCLHLSHCFRAAPLQGRTLDVAVSATTVAGLDIAQLPLWQHVLDNAQNAKVVMYYIRTCLQDLQQSS